VPSIKRFQNIHNSLTPTATHAAQQKLTEIKDYLEQPEEHELMHS
jgi:hypothetical protein